MKWYWVQIQDAQQRIIAGQGGEFSRRWSYCGLGGLLSPAAFKFRSSNRRMASDREGKSG
jgi:hypothetical protein